jgi:sugar O-acyltransferase (sialic acid O-acetyltransferase NeuD family)
MNHRPPPKPLLVLGTRPYALVFADAFSDLGEFEVVGFVENLDPARCRETLEGRPIHWIDDIGRYAATHGAICSLSTTFRDRFIEPVKQMGFEFVTLVHPTGHVSRKSILGVGVSVNVGSIVAGYTSIGSYVQINRGVTIGHHSVIEDYVTIQPGAQLAGNCRIGSQSYIGIGAVIVDGVTIGRHTVIGAGAVVTHDLPDRVLAVGVPAKVIREGIEGK